MLDEMYNVDKHYVYFNESVFTIVNRIISLEAGFLQIKKETFYGRSADGTDVVIPASDVISIEEGI